MKNLFNMKKSASVTTKTAIKMTPNQKPTTTVANISCKVKTAAFGVATGAGVAGSMMLQNERSIRNRKSRAEYHKKVEAMCTVAVGAAVVGATAAVVQGIFDPVVDMSMLEIEPAAFLELNNKAVELDGAETCSDEVETVEAEIVPEQEAAAPASAPKAEQTIVEATATEQPASAPADPAPVAPATPDPLWQHRLLLHLQIRHRLLSHLLILRPRLAIRPSPKAARTRMPMQQSDAKVFKSEYVLSFGCLARPP